MTRSELLDLVPEARLHRGRPTWARAALLVIDLQEYFRTVAAPILANVAGAIARCRAAGVPVVYTRHGHDDPVRDGGRLGEWWGDLIVRGTPEFALLPEIAPCEGERIVEKSRYSAFFGSDLEAHLRGIGVEELIVAGVMTNLCCETTARDAFVRDFRVFFLADGTATDGDDHQIASLRNLAYGFAHLLVCGEVTPPVASRSETSARPAGRTEAR